MERRGSNVKIFLTPIDVFFNIPGANVTYIKAFGSHEECTASYRVTAEKTCNRVERKKIIKNV